MNKKLLILVAIAMVVIIPAASACGRTAPTGITKLPAPKIPHAADVRFANCLVCHVADQLRATKPLPHTGMNYANKDCISAACHQLKAGVTTPPPTTTTKTTTATNNTGGTSTTSTTVSPPKTLSEVGLPNTTHSKAVLAAYKGLCLICHGQGMFNAQPYAPTWDGKAAGSVLNTGVYTITPGSKADHTGYTNETDCQQAGCHAAPTS